ncbi:MULTISPECIES: hypothetical protein [unclassified Neorhizobium]|uniref:hypothetical protein n=1 Tax=unclassified Neorhizobium TaxID=2629175 RepID=UPI001FF43469|nr:MULTISPECIES: hypothetical protein [unclassified Neorhizobium]MCJ9668546.1 hypothetical protein [Neorhizobium sp. SHOUNA12B]MCJ9744249.1 hypothetical protein [Neorhizobium sp. SHOUNA12A]
MSSNDPESPKPEFLATQPGYQSFRYTVPSPADMPIFVFASLRSNYEIAPIGARILSRGAIMIPTTFLEWSRYNRLWVIKVNSPATNDEEAWTQFHDWIWNTFPLFNWTPRMVNMARA